MSAQDRTRDRLTEVLTGPLAAAGLDLEAVELSQAGRRRVLRVAVDTDGGVTLDDIAEATRLVSRILDDDDVMGEQPYTLEVTSRGVDRPLSLPRHWRRNRGRLVSVSLRGGESVQGRIAASDVLGVDVADPSEPSVSRHVAFADVSTARVQVEFSTPDRR